MKGLPLLVFALLIAVVGGVSYSTAQPAYVLRMPSIVGDNMVLQQGQALRFRGWACPDAQVTLQFAGQTVRTRANQNGLWHVKLAPLKATAAPAILSVSSDKTLTFTNVLVGEVWLCSGQSNMEKALGEQRNQLPVFNHLQELAAADFPLIRISKVAKTMSATPMADAVTTGWLACNSNNLESIKFSAAAYFFGLEIHQRLKVPVGLIQAAWGGTLIEPWTSASGFAGTPPLAATVTLPEPGTTLSNRQPTVLYNAMIAPLAPFGIRGALWYQGEQNCVESINPDLYDEKMAALVSGWRDTWGIGSFPFYYVGLAPYHYCSGRVKPLAPNPEVLPEMWAAQSAACRIPNTGMIVTTDLVDNLNDVHPRNKQDVGRRLARLALAETYGLKEGLARSPALKHLRFDGSRARLTFSHAGNGLSRRDGHSLNWFSIAGKDGVFYPADAAIAGKNTVIASSREVPRPAFVRFGWHESAQPNLVNSAGLPAVPFSAGLAR